jgi:hypothetical protein
MVHKTGLIVDLIMGIMMMIQQSEDREAREMECVDFIVRRWPHNMRRAIWQQE